MKRYVLGQVVRTESSGAPQEYVRVSTGEYRVLMYCQCDGDYLFLLEPVVLLGTVTFFCVIPERMIKICYSGHMYSYLEIKGGKAKMELVHPV